MHMDNEITHVGIIDGALCGRLPSGVSLCIIRVDADDVQVLKVAEMNTVEVLKLPAEHEMQELLGLSFCGFDHVAFFPL